MKFWSFKIKDGVAELTIYGIVAGSVFWGDEVTPKEFKKDLDAIGAVNEIKIFINSDGGDVFAGQAIYSMLKRHEAKKTVYVDGLAASIASVIAMAGDKVIMPKNAMMMVHNPWTIGIGNAADFRKLADTLDTVGETIIGVYEAKTGLEKGKIVDLLDAETWLTADECVKMGFADEIEAEKQVAASVDGGFLMLNGVKMDLSRYKNAPKFIPVAAEKEPPKAEEQQPNGLLSLCEAQLQLNKNMFGR